MKNRTIFLKRLIPIILGICLTSATACGESHEHTFDCKIETTSYLCTDATCTEAAKYYYSCQCGQAGTETFSVGEQLYHDYSQEKIAKEYLKTPATCQSPAVYYKSCVRCGKSVLLSSQTFTAESLGEHAFTESVPDWKYIYAEATKETSPVYYKSCAYCGEIGTETFSYGDPLKEYTEEDKKAFTPVSLTITLYDTAESIYGFTYHTTQEPLRPVIQIQKGNSLTTEYEEFAATSTLAHSYDANDKVISYYVVKAEVDLEPSTTYTYRVYDKYVDVGTEAVTWQTENTKSTKFSFAHVSDTQSVPSSGKNFGNVLNQVIGERDFVLHTGDVVEYSKYEYEWTDMLHSNFAYLSKIPMMALSGNHDTTYKSGSQELFKHFNNAIPQQDSIDKGYYYSFVYGNAKFIMLNTNVTSAALEGKQYDWLIAELENNTCDWTFVALHCPLYSVGQWGADPSRNAQSLALRAQLQGVFAKYGVDVVLQGHDHLLSKTHALNGNGVAVDETFETIDGVKYSIDPNGVIYVMNGAVGTQTKSVISGADDSSIYDYASNAKVCSWADFIIDGNTLTVEAKYCTDTSVYTYQTWGITKSEIQ